MTVKKRFFFSSFTISGLLPMVLWGCVYFSPKILEKTWLIILPQNSYSLPYVLNTQRFLFTNMESRAEPRLPELVNVKARLKYSSIVWYLNGVEEPCQPHISFWDWRRFSDGKSCSELLLPIIAVESLNFVLLINRRRVSICKNQGEDFGSYFDISHLNILPSFHDLDISIERTSCPDVWPESILPTICIAMHLGR